MMFFVQHLQTYAPKNRAWRELVEFVKKYEDIIVKDEISLDALKDEIRIKIEQLNADHPKLKPIRFSGGHIDGGTIRLDSSVNQMGNHDSIFIMDICKVRSIYQYSEPVHSSNLVESK